MIATVTVPLEQYDEMQKEIKRLREEVQKKTIIKEVTPYWYEVAPYVIALIMVIAFIVFYANF